MEYIFGTIQKRGQTVDILKTVGDEHTDLTDNHEIVRKYPDCVITDVFNVKEKYLSKDDDEGKCYDWYVIENHYRYIDYFSPQKPEIDNAISETQEGLMETYELSSETADGMADVRAALEEIYEMIIEEG